MQLKALDGGELRPRYKHYHKKEYKMYAEILKRKVSVSNTPAMPSNKTSQQIFHATTLYFLIK
jgi:hypothetical protein